MASPIKPWAQAAMRRVQSHLPELRVGDVWEDVPRTGDRVRVERIVEDEGWPFPMLYYRHLVAERVCEDRDPRMGAPMVLFGRLAERGEGPPWKPLR